MVSPILVIDQALLRSISTLLITPPLPPAEFGPFDWEVPPQLMNFVLVSLSNALLQTSFDGDPPMST
ncbi:MAG: hypothetical protein EBT24_12905 [Betaproteobacteria bacterium]|nr:hypothetical protein [Betaproteobacteria bacterium]